MDARTAVLDDAERLVVLRALPGLGDLLCLVPALRALHARLPDARVSLVGLPAARWMVERFPHYLHEVVDFPGFPGLPEVEADPRALPGFLQGQHERRYDVALQLQGSGLASNPLTMLLGARRSAGFYLEGQYCPDATTFLEWNGYEHEVVRMLRLLAHIGVPPRGDHLEFPVTDTDRDQLSRATGTRDASRAYACLHPGATVPARRWPPDRFAEVARALNDFGLDVVVTGTATERDLGDEVIAESGRPGLNLAGSTSLGALAALLSAASVVVANDTGVAHLARAVAAPLVVLFRTSDPQRWAPPPGPDVRVLGSNEPLIAEQRSQPGCGRCLREACQHFRRDAADLPPWGVTAHEVIEAARSVSR